MAKRRTAQAGFTLVELMVVIAIIALLALIVGKGLGGQDNESAVTGFARKTLIAMRQARNTALDLGGRVRVVVAEQSLTIDRQCDVGSNPSDTTCWVRIGQEEASSRALIHAVTTSATLATASPSAGGVPSTILFNHDGSLANGYTIYIRDPKNTFQRKVVVFSITGYSKLITRW